MTTSVLSELFGGKYRSRILELLYLNPGESFHLRGISARTGVPPASLHSLLPKLSGPGLIRAAGAPGAKRYQANSELPGAADLMRLISHYGLPIQQLRQVADTLTSIVAAAVFGSYASGTARPDSDIDVLVVGAISRVDAQAAFKELARTLNRSINVTTLKSEEFSRQANAPSSFVKDVLSNPFLPLKGDLNAAANA